MTMILIKKNPSLVFSSFIPKIRSPSSVLRFSSSSTSQDQNPTPKSHFVTDYLISSCGFSPKRATAVSKYTTDLTLSERPDSVRHFLEHLSFTDNDIRTVISGYPRILATSVSQTLEPNLRSLTELGLAHDELRQLIICNPQALLLRSTIPRIEFWKTFWNGDMKKLLVAFKRNRSLITLDIEKNIMPKIALLKDYGFSDSQIGMVLSRSCRIFGKSITSIKMLLKRVQELRFDPGSQMFATAFLSLGCISPEMFKTKLELFKSFGWTDGEFTVAMNRSPFVVALSEENILKKINFLTERAGCTQNYIAFHPMLLNLSLEKRLMPRLCVLEILAKNESVKLKPDIYYIMKFPEKAFRERIILRYKEVVPTLQEAYVAACNGQL